MAAEPAQGCNPRRCSKACVCMASSTSISPLLTWLVDLRQSRFLLIATPSYHQCVCTCVHLRVSVCLCVYTRACFHVSRMTCLQYHYIYLRQTYHTGMCSYVTCIYVTHPTHNCHRGDRGAVQIAQVVVTGETLLLMVLCHGMYAHAWALTRVVRSIPTRLSLFMYSE